MINQLQIISERYGRTIKTNTVEKEIIIAASFFINIFSNIPRNLLKTLLKKNEKLIKKTKNQVNSNKKLLLTLHFTSYVLHK